jgi:enterochelin esterase-like enzyme
LEQSPHSPRIAALRHAIESGNHAAPPQPYHERRLDVPRGHIEMFHLRSTILGNERRVWVYTPPGYTSEGEAYGLLVLFDGLAYIDLVPTPVILENLLAEGKIPPVVGVLIDSLSHEVRSRELACYQPFVDYLTQELLPWVRYGYHVTSDPARTIVGGSSMGGLAASFAALRAPEIFGNVLSQSGSYWWRPDGDIEHEWLARQYVKSPRLPLRFYLDVGLRELSSTPGGGPTQVVVNRHMRNVLQAKGYEVHYAEFHGGHEYICWRGTIVDGLLTLT